MICRVCCSLYSPLDTHYSMTLLMQHRRVSLPAIGVHNGTLVIDLGKGVPEFLSTLGATVPHVSANDFSRLSIQVQPHPLLIALRVYKGPEFVTLHRQRPFFRPNVGVSRDFSGFEVDIILEPLLRNLHGSSNANHRDTF